MAAETCPIAGNHAITNLIYMLSPFERISQYLHGDLSAHHPGGHHRPSTRSPTTGLPKKFPVTQSSEMNDCDWLGKYYSEPGGPGHRRRHQVWHDLTHPHVSNCLLCHPFLLPEPARCTGLQISLAQFRTFPNFPWKSIKGSLLLSIFI